MRLRSNCSYLPTLTRTLLPCVNCLCFHPMMQEDFSWIHWGSYLQEPNRLHDTCITHPQPNCCKTKRISNSIYLTRGEPALCEQHSEWKPLSVKINIVEKRENNNNSGNQKIVSESSSPLCVLSEDMLSRVASSVWNLFLQTVGSPDMVAMEWKYFKRMQPASHLFHLWTRQHSQKKATLIVQQYLCKNWGNLILKAKKHWHRAEIRIGPGKVAAGHVLYNDEAVHMFCHILYFDMVHFVHLVDLFRLFLSWSQCGHRFCSGDARCGEAKAWKKSRCGKNSRLFHEFDLLIAVASLEMHSWFQLKS